jgi:hypothetical protein
MRAAITAFRARNSLAADRAKTTRYSPMSLSKMSPNFVQGLTRLVGTFPSQKGIVQVFPQFTMML